MYGSRTEPVAETGKEADDTGSADETPSSDATEYDGKSDEPTATPEEQTGFDGVVALVSLIAIAVLARRRSS